jgi:hypothetical protein
MAASAQSYQMALESDEFPPVQVLTTTTSPVLSVVAIGSEPTDRDLDFYAWLKGQAAALRTRQPKGIDWDGIAEELEAMGRSEEDGLESFLKRLYKHLLKWTYQPSRICASWEVSIDDSREQIQRRLKRSPSLKSKIGELAASAYRRARAKAGAQMEMRREEWRSKLPDTCPWSLDTATNTEYWPAPAELNS